MVCGSLSRMSYGVTHVQPSGKSQDHDDQDGDRVRFTTIDTERKTESGEPLSAVTAHSRMVSSSDPLATVLQSGAKATAHTGPVCPCRTSVCRPARRGPELDPLVVVSAARVMALFKHCFGLSDVAKRRRSAGPQVAQ